jgi:hypothetical protein
MAYDEQDNLHKGNTCSFALLLFTRIPAFATGSIDTLTLVSTVVELIFFIWGTALIVRR